MLCDSWKISETGTQEPTEISEQNYRASFQMISKFYEDKLINHQTWKRHLVTASTEF